MNSLLRSIVFVPLFTSAADCAEPVAKQFLRYVYGEDGIDFNNICHPSEDAWMLRGEKVADQLAALENANVVGRDTGVTSGVIGAQMYFIETRDGKVDPTLNLEVVYARHRQLVLSFIFDVLSQEKFFLERIVTDAGKITVANGPKAPPPGADMGVYAGVIEQMPVIRFSKPQDDAKSRTVTYRVPLGEEFLTLTIIKQGDRWLIDTSKSVRVDLEFFYRRVGR